MGYLGARLTQVFTCTQSERITQRCHNSPRWETGLQSANDVTHRKRAEDFGNLKKVRGIETRHRTRRLAFAYSRRPWAGVARDVVEEGGEKIQNRKIVPLSPHVEEPLNSKVIKSFVPEQRSRKCFSCFEIPIFYLIFFFIIQRVKVRAKPCPHQSPFKVDNTVSVAQGGTATALSYRNCVITLVGGWWG